MTLQYFMDASYDSLRDNTNFLTHNTHKLMFFLFVCFKNISDMYYVNILELSGGLIG